MPGVNFSLPFFIQRISYIAIFLNQRAFMLWLIQSSTSSPTLSRILKMDCKPSLSALAASLSSRVTTVTIFCFRLCALGSLVLAKHAQILPSGIAAEVTLYQRSSFRF
jgi:hypothetical protein